MTELTEPTESIANLPSASASDLLIQAVNALWEDAKNSSPKFSFHRSGFGYTADFHGTAIGIEQNTVSCGGIEVETRAKCRNGRRLFERYATLDAMANQQHAAEAQAQAVDELRQALYAHEAAETEL